MLAYCLRRTNSADAADACAETFLVAWRRLEDIPAEPDTLSYLYGVAGNVLRNQQRSRLRRAHLRERLCELGVAPPKGPEMIVVQSDRDREVVAAIRRLKPLDREILMLSAWEELSRSAIADLMGMSKAAVDQRIHRSYQRLAKMLGAASPPTNPPIPTPGTVPT